MLVVFEAIADWTLIEVAWENGSLSRINALNLVQMDEVGREAMKAEHKDNVRGMVIGSNAYLKFD